MQNFFTNLFSPIKQKKGIFLFLLILTIAMLVLGIISGRHLDSGVISIDLSNVPYIKFISKKGGFVSLIFNSLISLSILYLIIWICFIKPFLSPISLIFYFYFVYSQAVIFVNVLLIYGFFNALILLVFLLAYMLVLIFIFLLIVLELFSLCNSHNYFKTCFNPRNSNLLHLTLILISIVLIFSFMLMFLRSYIILLIY